MISPIDSDTRSGYAIIDLNVGRLQFENYAIYENVLEKSTSDENVVLGAERLDIFERANFALYQNIERGWGFVYHDYFIYDYKNKKKIAGFREIAQSINPSSIRNFLTLIRMPECTYNHGKYKSRDLHIKFLLENTFTKGDS